MKTCKSQVKLVAKVTPLSEHEEQTLLFKWIHATMEMQTNPRLRLALRWTHAIPNGYYKSIPMRMKAKREGVKSGILDVLVPCSELANIRSLTGYHALYIEMKRKGGTVSDSQEEFMEYLDLVHWKYAVCYCWQHAARTIVEFLGLTNYESIGEDPEWLLNKKAA